MTGKGGKMKRAANPVYSWWISVGKKVLSLVFCFVTIASWANEDIDSLIKARKYSEAEAILKGKIEVIEEQLGEDHPSIAPAL